MLDKMKHFKASTWVWIASGIVLLPFIIAIMVWNILAFSLVVGVILALVGFFVWMSEETY